MKAAGAFLASLATTMAVFFVAKQFVAPFLIITVLIFLGALCYMCVEVWNLTVGLVKASLTALWTVFSPMNLLMLLSAIIVAPIAIPVRMLFKRQVAPAVVTPVAQKVTPVAQKVTPVAKPVTPVAQKVTPVAKPVVPATRNVERWVPYPGVKEDLNDFAEMLVKGSLENLHKAGVGLNPACLEWPSYDKCRQMALRIAMLRTYDGEPICLAMDPEAYQIMMLMILMQLRKQGEYIIDGLEQGFMAVNTCAELEGTVLEEPTWKTVLLASLAGRHGMLGFLHGDNSAGNESDMRKYLNQ